MSSLLNQPLLTRLLVASLWTGIMVILLLSPGDSFVLNGISLLFGGTEFSDAVGHGGMYAAATCLWYWVCLYYRQPKQACLAILVPALLTGCVTEFMQRFIPNRDATLLDLIANCLGVALPYAWFWYPSHAATTIEFK